LKLFQIEEPDGAPVDPTVRGAAVGIVVGSATLDVAFSVGGNAVILMDREGFEQVLPTPEPSSEKETWQAVFEGARMRAERALARPVTHAVIALARPPDSGVAQRLREGAAAAGLEVLHLAAASELPAGPAPALAAAMLAEDLMPREPIG
jgi:hypothetical protein